jgi:hypothetical protein
MTMCAYTVRMSLMAKKPYRATAGWKKIRLQVLRRDAYTCAYCGTHDANEVDHIWPYSKGGEDTLDNLVACCRSCNIRKKDKTDSVFLGSASTPPAFSFRISPIRTNPDQSGQIGQTNVKIENNSPFTNPSQSGAN